MNSNLKKLLILAGDLALEEQSKMTIDTKSDQSIVTNGDIAVSKFLETELKKIYPDHDIFSEENTQILPTSNKVIIIDPIDGTDSYSRKQDSWSILIGFLDNMEIVGGVVYQPTKNLMYYGFKGTGAFKVENNKVTRMNAQNNGELKGVSSPKDKGENDFLNNLGITNIEYSYSAALKIMLVAEGYADAFPNFRKKCSLWDLVAPVAILQEAGGQIKYEDKIVHSFTKTHINSKFCCFGKNINAGDVFKN